MKVALVSTWDSKDGIAKYSQDLSKYLKEIVDLDIVEIDQPENSERKYWKNLGKKADKADVAHIQHEYGVFGNWKNRLHGILILPFLSQIKDAKIVTTLHSVEERSSPESFNPKKILKFFLMKYADRKLFKKSNRMIVHSNSSRQILEKRGVKPEKIEVIPHGVRTKETIDKRKAKEKLGYQEKDRIITLFGFIRKSKGYEKALKAAKNTDHQIMIAGGAETEGQKEYKKELQDISEKLGIKDRVKFTGYVEDEEIPVVMSATDLLILPYEEITGSGVLTLGITYGKPIITSNLEYFQEKEEKGILITFTTSDQLEKLITRENLQENSSIEEYRKKHSWKKTAEKTREVYKDALQ